MENRGERNPRTIMILTMMGHFVNDGSVFFVPVIIDFLAVHRGLSPTDVSIALFTFFGSSALSSLYFARLADRKGRPGSLIGIGLGTLSLGLLFFALGSELPSLTMVMLMALVSAIIAGVGSSFYHPLGASVLQYTYNQTQRGKALGIIGASGAIGRAVYPSAFFLVAAFLTQPGSIAFFALIGFGVAILIWGILRGQSYPTSTGSHMVSKTTLKKELIPLTSLAFLRGLAGLGAISWMPVFISFTKGKGLLFSLGYNLSFMYIAGIISQPLFGYLGDRYDKRWLLALTSLGQGLAILAYIYTSNVIELMSLFFVGFFVFSSFSLLMSLVSEYVPKGQFSIGNALVWGIGTTLGGAIGPLVVGFIVAGSYDKLPFAFEVLAGISVLSMLLCFILPSQRERSELGRSIYREKWRNTNIKRRPKEQG